MRHLSSFISVLFVILSWHLLVTFNVVDAEFFPSPLAVLDRLFFLIRESDFRTDIAYSMLRLTMGTLISFPLAFLLALLCSHSKAADTIISPFIGFTYPLPKVAIIPLLMLIFGIGNSAKIIIISLGMFYLLFIHLRHSMKHLISSSLASPIKIYGIKGYNYFYYVLFKGVFLDLFKSLKIALGYGLTLVVVSEFSMTKNGIGNFIWKSWDQFRIIDMYAGVYFLCLTGFFLYYIFDLIILKISLKYHS